ncbi:hypothetical protein HYH03_001588 [Edaphochlamys debaryana]|uniref:Uncharacterized protein n=1 Tax=Edaphochlamys debaryana TaxID=47281 RepID=A0A835YH31_9CHLO|nr:hypothetical protein HYH03_001588 [Edaphochlamys debaryana]|eukprot:KAG2500826.1 hypothetical protein HYH03_001588 [Edaphochlamys debaryana]
MKDVASKEDFARLERTMTTRFDQMREEFNSRFHQMQLLAVLLALAVVAILGLLAGALVFFPLNPGSALGMVVSACIKKM